MTLPFRNIPQALLAISVLLNVATAQEERDEPVRQNLPVSYEAIPFYSADTTAAVVRLHYRINQRFFIFIRDAGNENSYSARGELMVELRNKQDISMGREIRQIHLLRDSQPRENELLPDLQGSLAFQVPEDEYTVIFSVDDKESGRKFIDRDKKVITKLPLFEPLELSNPLFARLRHDNDDESETYIIPSNRGTQVTFGSTSGIAYQIYLPDAGVPNVRWRIQRQGGLLADWFQSFAGEHYTLLKGGLTPINPQDETRYKIQPTGNPEWKLLYIPLPIEKLEPGGYTINLELGVGEKQIKRQFPFQVIWLNRPAALLNSELAIDALQHIATEDEISEMRSGSFERNVKAFYEFWKRMDPDTTTAYNEMMVEFYRRVDETNRRFSTPNSLDGYKTDRGRIFILYGQPTRIDRILPPGEAPSEFWAYDRLKRRFVFSDKYKSGNFVLTSADSL